MVKFWEFKNIWSLCLKKVLIKSLGITLTWEYSTISIKKSETNFENWKSFKILESAWSKSSFRSHLNFCLEFLATMWINDLILKLRRHNLGNKQLQCTYCQYQGWTSFFLGARFFGCAILLARLIGHGNK